jgi:hypothetical protein
MDLGRRDHTRWLGSSGRYSTRLTLPTTNLLAAWDARLGVTNVSGACSAWADQSGNGYHASQGTAGARPTITTASGYASLQFDGTADYLEAAIAHAASQKTIYAVITPGTIDAGARCVCSWTTGAASVGANASKHQAHDATSWRDTGITYASGLQSLSYDMVTTGMTFRKNGSAASPTTWSANPAFTRLRIGSGPSAWYFSGHLHGLFVYNAAHNPDVAAYITQEWGV